jgi:hypothetical protein
VVEGLNLLLGDGTKTDYTAEQIEFLKAIEVGEFEESDMTQYTVQLDKLVREISQASQTPIYGVTAQGNLSGEALKQLEVGLIGKVNRFQRENTDAIRKLLKLTSAIQNNFQTTAGDAPDLKDVSISVNWKSPEIVDVSVQIQALRELRRDNPGLWSDEWYRERIGAALGMTQKQITEEGEKARDEQSLNFARLTGELGDIPVVA